MNKVYKVVWNASLGVWVAVSELAKGKTKNSGSVVRDVSLRQQAEYLEKSSVKYFNYKVLSLAIFTFLTPTFTFAESGTGGGNVGGGAGSSNTAISPTNAQCNVGGFSQPQASITGANTIQSVAIGCGSIVGATNTTSQQIGDRRGGTDPVTYPSGETGYRSAGTAIGNRNSTAAGGGLAIGTGNASTGDFYGVAVGQGNNADAYGVAVGIGNLSNSTSAVAIGTANQATGNTAIAVGRQSYAKGDNSIAVGNIATSDGKSSISIGDASLSTTVDSISIGRNAKSGFGGSSDVNAIAIGADSTSYAYGVALGNGATADQNGFTSTNGGIAIGSDANTAAGTLAGVALGNSAKVTGSAVNSVAIGKDANVSVNNSVALGAGSTTTAQSGNSFLTNVAASTTNGVVSVGTTSATRRIQNVADGAALTDAVNVAQLDKAYDDTHSRLATALGGGAAYNSATNAYTAPTYNVTTDPAAGTKTGNVNNVGAALSGLDTAVNKAITFSGNTGTSSNKLGSSLNITGGLIGAGSNANVKTVITGNTLDIQIADAPTFTGTVTAGNLATGGTLSVAGASNLNGGANLNNQKITNLAAGTVASDAVNFGQLTTTNNNVTAAQNTANTALTNANNAQTSANTALTNANNAQTSANAAQSTADTALTEAQKGINFGDGTTNNNYALGETINVKGDSNVNSETTADGVQLSLASDITVDSVTTGNSKLDTNGLVITGGPSVTTAGIDAGSKVITNVADGSAPNDAVNFGQLTTTNNNVTQNTTDIATNTANITTNTNNIATNTSDISNLQGQTFKLQANGDTASAVASSDTVQFIDGDNIEITRSGNDITVATSKDLTVDSVTAGNSKLDTNGLVITGGPSVTTAGIDAGSKVITNVADGSAPNDAVNFGQLTTTNNNVAQNTTDIATNTANITTNTNNIATNTGDITTLKGGFNLQTNGSNSSAIKAGDTVDIGVVDPADTNLTATKTGNNVAFALSQDLSLTSVTTGNTVINNAGVTADKVTVGNVVIDKTTNQISGVEAGTNTKDAVNKGQLDALAAQQAENDNAVVKYDDAAVKDKVTLAGAGGTTLTNVKAGDVSATSTDAVNGSQLFTTNQKVDENTSNIAKNTGDISTLNTTVTNQGNDITTLKGGFNLQTNGSNSGAIKAGDAVDIGVVDPADTNLTATKTGNNVAFALSQDLSLTSVTTNQLQVGSVVVDKSTNTITGLSNKDLNGSDFATQGRAATEEQLKVVENQVVTTQTSLVNSLGGGAKVNADGTITGPTYNVAQSTQSNVGDALDALDKAIGSAATTSKTTVSNGENIVVNKSKNADGSDNYEVSTAKDLTVDSIKAGDTVLNNAGVSIGNNTVVLNNTGLIIAGGPSVTTQGIDAGNKQITNVAAGTNATDAVNKGQLDSAISNVNNNVNELANNAVKYDDASKDKITLGGADGTTITNVKDGKVEQNSKNAVNGGQLWNVQEQVNQNTSDISNIQTNINNINDGKSGLVQQQTPNGEITVGKDTGGTTVNVAGKDGDRVVTGVKDGTISATSKDAVNGSQLNATNNKVVEFLGGGAGYDNITNSFTNPTYTVGDTTHNNVGGAIDALNKADQALDSKIDNVSNRLEQAFYSTNQRIDNVEKRANAGIAAAMALEAAPYIAGKYTYAAGASYHGGENAVGVTLRKTADNGRWSITGGVAAASQGDPSVRIGISGVID
ncbi:hypothetical protein EAH57_07800 [Acinetobacter sp. 2JN-4]|uniref:ESPR-type extended signal peptide-containing protein n=1 Tax=Acinetobacter sp. 2JN-4 TaxID=2479844 RepID=UPI000EF9ED41|nr:ESPR-type extended signal peptide-containing protein [Acinetobacter sp. 2JN-4]RLZ08917.1 hypothetical protein EAH57_07800 [Acinetobacter sp. 2JN-4]